MEIKEENKLKKQFKRYGTLGLACVFAFVVALTIALGMKDNGEPASTGVMNFGLPMYNAVVVKDYADDHLQLNDTLDRWEIHLGVDLVSENDAVYSIYDGVVASVESDSLNGHIVTINHAGGFASVYSSLNKNVKVKEGDRVTKGQQIGSASDSAPNESETGSHLHFMLLKDGTDTDPNNYLDLQNK